MSVKLLAYKNGSASAKSLRDALAIKMLKKNGSKWTGKVGDTIINWGSSTPFPKAGGATYLNKPEAVALAANKLKTQKALTETGNPFRLPWTENKELAGRWIAAGKTIVCRTKLTGNSGEGIIIAEKPEELVDAPLYTLYRKKEQEYRVHVFDGEVISVQRKARKRDVADDDVNWKVRNLEGGFIFARQGFEVPNSVAVAALKAVRDLGLDFGAVDIGYHNHEGTFIYEVNTACGLDGSNLLDYARAFQRKLGMPLTELPENYVAPALPAEGFRKLAPIAEELEQVAHDEELWQRPAEEMAMPEPAPAPQPPVAPAAPVALEPAPLGSRENPFGNGTILRQVRHDLDENVANTNEDMVRYAGKWILFDKDNAFFANDAYPLDYDGWNWGEVHLEPEAPEVNLANIIDGGRIAVGNIDKELTKEQVQQLIVHIANI